MYETELKGTPESAGEHFLQARDFDALIAMVEELHTEQELNTSEAVAALKYLRDNRTGFDELPEEPVLRDAAGQLLLKRALDANDKLDPAQLEQLLLTGGFTENDLSDPPAIIAEEIQKILRREHDDLAAIPTKYGLRDMMQKHMVQSLSDEDLYDTAA